MDTLRALAIITVILFHISKRVGFVVYPDFSLIPSFNWILTDFLATCCRCGVDIFLMLSGALSLGRVWDIKSFLGKRIPRIVLPFLFWGFVLCVFVTILCMAFPSFYTEINMYNYLFLHSLDLNSFLVTLGNSYMGNNRWFGPYWFFWMILGTYLIMPIFNKWIYNSSLKEVEYFLVIWLVTCLFDKTLLVTFPIKLTYFTGPIGMVVLGYYLRHTDRKIFSSLKFSVILLILSVIATLFASYYMSDVTQIYVFNRYCIFLAIEVIGIFLVFKNIDKLNLNFFNGENSLFRKATFSIAKYSYGIYLVHQVFMNLLIMIFLPIVHYKVLVIILFVGTLAISWLLLAVLNRIPYLNQVIGAK